MTKPNVTAEKAIETIDTREREAKEFADFLHTNEEDGLRELAEFLGANIDKLRKVVASPCEEDTANGDCVSWSQPVKYQPHGLLRHFSRAIEEVSHVAEHGAAKRGETLADVAWPQECTVDYFLDKVLRHYFAHQTQPWDAESHRSHLAHMAFDCLAALELYLRFKSDDEGF